MFRTRRFLAMVAVVAAFGAHAGGERTPAPEGATAYIIAPANGAVVKSPVKVVFGLSGMGVAPAGVDREQTGHHHLLIDVDDLPSMNKPIPADEQHRHLGGGQTEIEVELKPGKHSLQLLLGDRNHVPHRPPVKSEKISITVVDPGAKIDVKAGARINLGQ